MAELRALVLVLGGDGSILRALSVEAKTGAPVLGVNFGRVGFLATVEQGDISAKDLENTLMIPRLKQAMEDKAQQFLKIENAGGTKFEGRYAIVGREMLEGRDVLRIEYYPEKLFTPDTRRERREDAAVGRGQAPRRGRDSDAARSLDAELLRLMNKSSKVTLWVDPAAHQILKYTFDDLGWNFFPGQWLAQMDGVTATMEMGEAFPDVWLPRRVDMRVGMLMALGRVELRYGLTYDSYRQADVQSAIRVPTP